jgi:hypothetical protein
MGDLQEEGTVADYPLYLLIRTYPELVEFKGDTYFLYCYP